MKAAMAIFQGNYEIAEQAYRKAIENFSAINDQRFSLVSQSDLAHFLRRMGKIEEAIPIYQETLLKWQEQANLPALAHQLECFAYIAISKGKHEHAASLLGKARDIRTRLSSESILPSEIAEMEQAVQQLTAVLGETERERLMHEGEGFSLDDTVRLALAEVQSIPA